MSAAETTGPQTGEIARGDQAAEPERVRAGSFDHVVFWGLTGLMICAVWTIWPAGFSTIASDMVSARYLMEHWIELPVAATSPVTVLPNPEPGRLVYFFLAALAAASSPLIAVKITATLLILGLAVASRALGNIVSPAGSSILILPVCLAGIGMLEFWPSGFSLGLTISVLMIAHWLARTGERDIASLLLVVLASAMLVMVHPPFWILTFAVISILAIIRMLGNLPGGGQPGAMGRFIWQFAGMIALVLPAAGAGWFYADRYNLLQRDALAFIPVLAPGPTTLPIEPGIGAGLATNLVLGLILTAAACGALALMFRVIGRRAVFPDTLLLASAGLLALAALPVAEIEIGELSTRYRVAAGMLGMIAGLAWAGRGLEWWPARYTFLMVITVMAAVLFGLRITSYESSRPLETALLPLAELMERDAPVRDAPVLVLDFTRRDANQNALTTGRSHTLIALNSGIGDLAARAHSLGTLNRLVMQNPPARFKDGADPIRAIGPFDKFPASASPRGYLDVTGLPLVWIVVLGDPLAYQDRAGLALIKRLAPHYESVFRRTAPQPLNLYIMKDIMKPPPS